MSSEDKRLHDLELLIDEMERRITSLETWKNQHGNAHALEGGEY